MGWSWRGSPGHPHPRASPAPAHPWHAPVHPWASLHRPRVFSSRLTSSSPQITNQARPPFAPRLDKTALISVLRPALARHSQPCVQEEAQWQKQANHFLDGEFSRARTPASHLKLLRSPVPQRGPVPQHSAALCHSAVLCSLCDLPSLSRGSRHPSGATERFCAHVATCPHCGQSHA